MSSCNLSDNYRSFALTADVFQYVCEWVQQNHVDTVRGVICSWFKRVYLKDCVFNVTWLILAPFVSNPCWFKCYSGVIITGLLPSRPAWYSQASSSGQSILSVNRLIQLHCAFTNSIDDTTVNHFIIYTRAFASVICHSKKKNLNSDNYLGCANSLDAFHRGHFDMSQQSVMIIISSS